MFAFKSYKINFSSPNATGVFRRGETLSGELRFVLGREIEIKQITVTLKGKASVLWETKQGKASIDHKGKVVYYRDREVLLRAPSGSTLKPGVHVYPFLCKLPRGNFPSTFKSGHGKISYSVIFEIHRSVNQSKTLESEFQFERLVNVNVPALLMPQSATKSTSLYRFCCTVTGDLSMDVLVDKKGYVPGETITITIEGENGTSSTIVPTAELERKVIYYEDGMINQKSKSKQVKYVVGEHVKPNTSEFKGEIKLCIPKDTYITLQDCKVLVVEYSLTVGLSANAATALTAVFPIVIGNSPPMPEEPETN
ncbi:arrestin domain-containing protein 3-like [Engraulis encrasicolus]|uniref:arrestin domain-containing protein 3-like n=1 Tax=Engraulis encrasicolus TaxID=184585 RepID=UPI002FCF9081